jgi:hypothetical protein
MDKVCINCGAKLNRGNMFCSRKCRGIYSSNKIIKKCKECGKKFITTPSRKDKLFCSKTCHNKSMIKISTKKCIHCNKEFIGYSSRKYCSKICADICNGKNKRIEISTLKTYFNKEGYVALINKYENAFTKFDVICNNGHNFKTTWNDFQQGKRCPKCSRNVSNGENELYEKLYEVFKDIKIERNNRNIISPKELDIYIPEYKLAIEYCGLYWHSEDVLNVKYSNGRRYHREKMEKCKSKGIQLITIFEDEWKLKSDIIISLISRALNKSNKIHARKCKISELTPSQANEFYAKNHLQGATHGKLHVGLFYKDELVKAMSFGSPSRNINGIIELKRDCTKIGCTVTGGFSKILKYFCNIYKLPIRSYVDLRYFNGITYDKLGFKYLGESKYTPHYVKSGIRYRNQSLQKTEAERKTNKTEYELRKEQGYSRIWDCGHQVWEYVNG